MRYEAEVRIDAAPETVWIALADVERWPEWTASVTSIERIGAGPFELGSQARVRQPKLAKAVYTVTEFEPNQSFTWTTQSADIKTVAAHYIEPQADGGSTVRLVLTQTGLFAPALKLFVGRLIRGYLTMEAEGLKARAEGRV